MKHLKSVLFVFVALAFVLAACGAPATTEAPAATEAPAQPVATEAPATEAPTAEPTVDPNLPVSGGTVIIGTPQEPGVLNPLLTSASIEDIVGAFVIEGLVDVNDQGEYVPVLAEELPTVSADGLTITYKLRQGVKFNNGDEFTCDDVVFTKDAILSDLSQASTSGYGDITNIECPDKYTAVVTMSAIYAPYLRLFTFIIPKAAGDITKLDTWEYNRAPIGTGPFMVKEWAAGDNITMVKNPYYREEGKPYLDSVIFKILPSREVGVQLLGTGEITVLWDLTEADFPTLAQMKDQGVSYMYIPDGENEYLVLNFADPTVDAPADPAKNPHPILFDLKVRQAIQMAINKQELVDTLLYGNAKVGNTVVAYGPFACPQPVSEFNPDKAKALLDEAGWKPGADGIREKNGVRMSLKITSTTGNQLREQTEQVLQENLKAVGIELVIDNVPSDVLFASWDSDGLRKHGKFDILMYTTGPGIDPDSHLFSNYHSARIPTKDNEGAGSNYSRYINADVDKWIDDAAATTDTAARKDLYCKIAAQINADLPRILLYERLLVDAYRANLQGFTMSPGPADMAWGAQNWWLKP